MVFIASFVTKVIGFITPVRVSEEEEYEGLTSLMVLKNLRPVGA